MQKDIKIHYISDPEQNNSKQLVFSIRSKNKSGYKYYIMNLPNEKNNRLELKRIDNAMLLLSEIHSRPISIEKEKDEFLTAIALLELAIKEACKLAGKKDVVLVAGKGHEDYQILANETIHFDDREKVREIFGAVKA